MRHYHGIKIASDFGLNGNHGYPMIGRLKALAEITLSNNKIYEVYFEEIDGNRRCRLVIGYDSEGLTQTYSLLLSNYFQ